MKRLLVLVAMLAVLAVCTPSYGYILVYKVTGGMKALEWVENTLSNVSVKGYLAMEIDDVNGAVTDAEMVLYGKDAAGNLVYYLDGLNDPESDADNGVFWDNSGLFVGLDIWNYNNPFEYEFVMTGKVKDADVGLGIDDKRAVVSSFKGTLLSWWGQLLDGDQDLFGSGTSTMTLDTKQTKAANAANVITPGSVTVDSIITTFISGLTAKDYNPINL